MKTTKITTINEIEEKTGGNISPEFYYEWGSEPQGCVSTGLYIDEVWYNTGYILKSEAIKMGLKYHCPYN